jgi:hypothetical protein
MDVDTIRSQFIRDNLRLAIMERDPERRLQVLEAFRAYFEWFGARCSERERLGIQALLATLEALRTSKLSTVR